MYSKGSLWGLILGERGFWDQDSNSRLPMVLQMYLYLYNLQLVQKYPGTDPGL